MRVAIIGSRKYPNLQQVRDFVNTLPQNIEVVSGGGGDVDLTAQWAAEERGMKVTIFPANWQLYGKSAGPRRNADIIANCDVVIAFPFGDARGTMDTIRKANLARPTRRYMLFEPEDEVTWAIVDAHLKEVT